MKRLLCLLLVCLLILPGCAAALEPELSEMLGTLEGSTYTSPFGLSIDLQQLRIQTADQILSLNGLDSSISTEDALMEEFQKGNAAAILVAADAENLSDILLSMVLSEKLPAPIQTVEDYADHSLSTIPGKLEDAGYTDIQVRRITVTLDDGEHPAILCSARITEDYSYHLLQICFQKGDWMGGLSLCSLESEEALRDLLTRVTSTNQKGR